MAGDVRHFEIPYVKAYLAKRFHITAFSWKLNDTPHNGDTMVRTDPSLALRMPTEMSMVNGSVLGRNALTAAQSSTSSRNHIDKASEHVRHGGGEVVHERQSVGEMG